MIYPYSGLSAFSLFFSSDTTQAFLKKCYMNQQVIDADQKSYENCYPFIYYIEHGLIYYNQAKSSPLVIQPILLFYGLVHLIKACILTVDPNYPETTSVLAHGVSTRKRKKQDYHFFQDEVKLQKTGLFPAMAEKLFGIKQLEGEKIIMNDLLRQVPELSDLFGVLEGGKSFIKVDWKEGHICIPEKILDAYHMTADRFIDYFEKKTDNQFYFDSPNDHSGLRFSLNEDKKLTSFTQIKYDLSSQLFFIPLTRGDVLSYDELLIHYLLLYNLSMIARYETEWWSELVKTMPNKDYPFIKTFLEVTLEKGPFLIFQFLIHKKK